MTIRSSFWAVVLSGGIGIAVGVVALLVKVGVRLALVAAGIGAGVASFRLMQAMRGDRRSAEPEAEEA